MSTKDQTKPEPEPQYETITYSNPINASFTWAPLSFVGQQKNLELIGSSDFFASTGGVNDAREFIINVTNVVRGQWGSPPTIKLSVVDSAGVWQDEITEEIEANATYTIPIPDSWANRFIEKINILLSDGDEVTYDLIKVGTTIVYQP